MKMHSIVKSNCFSFVTAWQQQNLNAWTEARCLILIYPYILSELVIYEESSRKKSKFDLLIDS